jgi:hypothetical protein
MNLKIANGKVPVYVGGDIPYVLVDFPSKTVFFDLYTRKIKKELLVKYWNVLRARSKGASLSEAGEPYDLSKERIRQIEAKFLRLFREHYYRLRSKDWPDYSKESSSRTDLQESSRP